MGEGERNALRQIKTEYISVQAISLYPQYCGPSSKRCFSRNPPKSRKHFIERYSNGQEEGKRTKIYIRQGGAVIFTGKTMLRGLEGSGNTNAHKSPKPEKSIFVESN